MQQTNLVVSPNFCPYGGGKVCQVYLQNVKKDGEIHGQAVYCPLRVDMAENC
jgi:hypothetical protein